MNGHSGKKVDQSVVQKAVRYSSQGLSVDQIASRLNVSKTSIRSWLKKQVSQQPDQKGPSGG